MKNIFLTLAVLATLLLLIAFVLGFAMGDPSDLSRASQTAFGWHFWSAFGGLVFASLVHAIVLTYFMGTGRWLEETTQAYSLSNEWYRESRALKQRTIPAMMACLLLLVVTGAFGAAIDPGAAVGFEGWLGLSGATIHFLFAVLTLAVNAVVSLWEYLAIDRNGRLIEQVVGEVRRLREERGLPV